MAFVVTQVIAVVLLVIGNIAAVALLYRLGSIVKLYAIITIPVCVIAAIVCLRLTYMVATKNGRFLRYYDILMIITVSFVVLGMLITGFDASTIRSLLSSIVGFVIYTAYVRKSVRVRTYMGSDEYLRLSIFSKNTTAPSPAVPDDAGAAAGYAGAGDSARRYGDYSAAPQAYAQNAEHRPPSAYNPAPSIPAPPAAPADMAEAQSDWEIEPVCPKCGRENPNGKFCQGCGAKLAVVRKSAARSAGR